MLRRALIFKRVKLKNNASIYSTEIQRYKYSHFCESAKLNPENYSNSMAKESASHHASVGSSVSSYKAHGWS